MLCSRAHRSEIPNLEFSTLHISGCNRLELRRFPLNKPLILWWQSSHYLCTLSIPWFESHVPLSNYLESHTHTQRVTRMLSYTISKGRPKWGTVHILRLNVPLYNRCVAHHNAMSTLYKVCVPRYAKCRVFWAQLPLIRTLLTPHHPSQHPSCFSQSPMTRSPIMIFVMGRNALNVPSSSLCQFFSSNTKSWEVRINPWLLLII